MNYGGCLYYYVSHIKAQADDMGLDGCWSLKPLLDGKAIIGSLGLQKVVVGSGRKTGGGRGYNWPLIYIINNVLCVM